MFRKGKEGSFYVSNEAFGLKIEKEESPRRREDGRKGIITNGPRHTSTHEVSDLGTKPGFL